MQHLPLSLPTIALPLVSAPMGAETARPPPLGGGQSSSKILMFMHGVAVGRSHCTPFFRSTWQPSARLDGYQGLHGNPDEVTFEGRKK